MISREEAHKRRQRENNARCFDHSHMFRQINEIYDSIGSCGECTHLKEEYNDRNCSSMTINTCDGRLILKPKEHFCADFERKTDVT